jgi:hypothetical protein
MLVREKKSRTDPLYHLSHGQCEPDGFVSKISFAAVSGRNGRRFAPMSAERQTIVSPLVSKSWAEHACEAHSDREDH